MAALNFYRGSSRVIIYFCQVSEALLWMVLKYCNDFGQGLVIKMLYKIELIAVIAESHAHLSQVSTLLLVVGFCPKTLSSASKLTWLAFKETKLTSL